MERTERPIINGIQMPHIMQMRINGIIRVVDFTIMDKMVGKPEGYSEALFNANKDRFIKYRDYFYTSEILNLTETGCLLLARLFDVDTDASFAIQRYIFQELVNNREYTYECFHNHTVKRFEQDYDRTVRKYESKIRDLKLDIEIKDEYIQRLKNPDAVLEDDDYQDPYDLDEFGEYDPVADFDQYVDGASRVIIKNAEYSDMIHDMIPTRHIVAFYDIDELELHKIASDGEIQSEDDYDALPYTYKLYDSQRYVRHDWFKDKKNVNSMFWTEAGVRYLVEMLGRKRIFIQSRYKVRTPYDPPSDT